MNPKVLLPILLGGALGAGILFWGILGDREQAERPSRHDRSSPTLPLGNDNRALGEPSVSGTDESIARRVYEIDGRGNPLSCTVFGSSGQKIYKASFGYSKRPGPTYAKVVQERLYDARVKRSKPGTTVEMPAHIFFYSYKSNGELSRTIGFDTIKHSAAEEIFGCKVEPLATAYLRQNKNVSPETPDPPLIGP